jgi:DNA-binding transcriptional regulator/RsmH inhibitor MraZ
MDYASLGDSVVMVGALTTIQIWSPEHWEKFRMADEAVLDEIQRIGERSDSLADLIREKL